MIQSHAEATRMKNKILDILQKTANGFLAGMLISIGGAVFLACYLKNSDGSPAFSYYVGSFMFPIALLCICMKGYSLYTGRIGYVLSVHKKEDISVLLLGLLGNVLGTAAFGYLCGWVFPNMKETASFLCAGKLGQGYLFGLLRAVLCGILVYLAVDIYKNNKSVLGVLIGIPVFILSGYEHSIADMFYFAVYGAASWQTFGYIWMILIGNSLGALLIPAIQLIKPKKEQTE